jgi:hypothetical protein
MGGWAVWARRDHSMKSLTLVHVLWRAVYVWVHSAINWSTKIPNQWPVAHQSHYSVSRPFTRLMGATYASHRVPANTTTGTSTNCWGWATISACRDAVLIMNRFYIRFVSHEQTIRGKNPVTDLHCCRTAMYGMCQPADTNYNRTSRPSRQHPFHFRKASVSNLVPETECSQFFRGYTEQTGY